MHNMFFALDGEAAAAGTQNGGAGMSMVTMVIYLVAIVAFFYFFMIRPQKKQEKQTADMRNSLEIGDEVTTIGGIIGRVTHIKDDVITVETGADRNKIRVRRSAISTIDLKNGDTKAPKGGYKVTGVKKSEDKPSLKEPLKEDKSSSKKEDK